MKLNPKHGAAALLCALVVAAAVPATAAAPAVLTVPMAPAITLPWESTTVESIDTGNYDTSMLLGSTQQLSPIVLPKRAASLNPVSFASENPSVATVASDGTVTAVGTGTTAIAATAGDASCVYMITVKKDSSMIVTEMDVTLAASAIYVGDTTTVSLAVLPTTAANYADVTLSSSNTAIATVNNFGKVTGIAPGTATIIATCGDVTASANIRVVEVPSSSSNASSTQTVSQSLTLNTNYVVLKPGASRTITGKVTPSSAKQSLTFTSQDKSVATVSGSGVITAVGTGATSIIVSNGTASASVSVIVNQSASSTSSDNEKPDDNNNDTPTDPIVAAIQSAEGDEVTFAQSEVPTITAEMLNVLRKTGKTLVVTGEGYTLRLHGNDVKDTAATVSTALTFEAHEHGQTFVLNDGAALPGTVEIDVEGDAASYSRLYLHNSVTDKWQYLNTYSDGVIDADTAGQYLLTNENLRFTSIDWTFFIAAGAVVVACIVAYIVVKKRYWFW